MKERKNNDMTTLSLTASVQSFDQIIPLLLEKLDIILQSDQSVDKLLRISIQTQSISLKDWLATQSHPKKLYWSNRIESFAVAGIGSTLEIRSDSSNTDPTLFANISQILTNTDSSIRLYGGGRFSSDYPKQAPWDIYGDIAFYLPRFELILENDSTLFAMNLYPEQDELSKQSLIQEIKQLRFDTQSSQPVQAYNLISRTDSPDFDRWSLNLTNALDDITTGKYEKIVMARQSDFRFQQSIIPFTLFQQLTANAPACFQYYFQQDQTLAFMGATPELLFSRDNGSINCEAIAGTRRRGATEKDDHQLGEELLNSVKERSEQAFVSRSIYEALKPYLTDDTEPIPDSVNLLRLRRVQHLISRFRFKLNSDVSVYNLIKALHPTAAVGGYPKEDVLARIYDLEQFDRGWYASPIGWVSKDKSEFAVALRCGLVQGNLLSLYAGAGIVPGSIPKNEWVELENKIAGFMKVIS